MNCTTNQPLPSSNKYSLHEVIITQELENAFKMHLHNHNMAANSIRSYLGALHQYQQRCPSFHPQGLREYKVFLLEHYKPQTVNLRLRGINCCLEFIGQDTWKLPLIKVQQKPFLEHVISEADYLYFKNCLLKDNELFWYFVVRFLACTGARVSELLQIKVEHVRLGHLDLYSKGGKLRRIYIPITLQKEALSWLQDINRKSGFIFVKQNGSPITSRGISFQLKHFGMKYGLDPAVIYPHSFRHLFAKCFLQHYNDISLLADLMGHESIETTRIYLRKTSSEQQNLINQIVVW